MRGIILVLALFVFCPEGWSQDSGLSRFGYDSSHKRARLALPNADTPNSAKAKKPSKKTSRTKVDRLSLIVSAEDRRHFVEALQNYRRALESPSVLPGRLAVSWSNGLFGSNLKPSLEKLKTMKTDNLRTQANKLNHLQELKLIKELDGCKTVSVHALKELASHYNISASPTWIVHSEAEDYVFEGFTDYSTFMTRDGYINELYLQ